MLRLLAALTYAEQIQCEEFQPEKDEQFPLTGLSKKTKLVLLLIQCHCLILS